MTAEERAQALFAGHTWGEDDGPGVVDVASAIRAAEVEARADAERARAEADARYCDLMSRTERLVSEAADEALERAATALEANKCGCGCGLWRADGVLEAIRSMKSEAPIHRRGGMGDAVVLASKDGGQYRADWDGAVERLKREAADEALERAAREIESTLATCLTGPGCDRCAAIRFGATQIRSLKSSKEGR